MLHRPVTASAFPVFDVPTILSSHICTWVSAFSLAAWTADNSHAVNARDQGKAAPILPVYMDLPCIIYAEHLPFQSRRHPAFPFHVFQADFCPCRILFPQHLKLFPGYHLYIRTPFYFKNKMPPESPLFTVSDSGSMSNPYSSYCTALIFGAHNPHQYHVNPIRISSCLDEDIPQTVQRLHRLFIFLFVKE